MAEYFLAYWMTSCLRAIASLGTEGRDMQPVAIRINPPIANPSAPLDLRLDVLLIRPPRPPRTIAFEWLSCRVDLRVPNEPRAPW
jgi:hypothetical protein